MRPAWAQTQPAEQIVYQSKYDDPKNLEHWSKPQVEANAGRPFLGRFNNSTQSLSLKDLPRHTFIQIRAQILIFDSWDGSRTDFEGPDQLSIRLGDGRTLLQSTFTLGGKSQSFPDNYRTGDYPALTGAEAHNVAWLPRSKREWGENGIYPVEFIIPHAASDLRIDFRGMLIDTDPSLDNESWGLGEVKVSLLEQSPVKLTAGDVKKLLRRPAWRRPRGKQQGASYACFIRRCGRGHDHRGAQISGTRCRPLGRTDQAIG